MLGKKCGDFACSCISVAHTLFSLKLSSYLVMPGGVDEL